MEHKKICEATRDLGRRHGQAIMEHKILHWIKAHPFLAMANAAFTAAVATFAGCNSDQLKVVGLAAGLILAQAIGAMVAVWRAKGL